MTFGLGAVGLRAVSPLAPMIGRCLAAYPLVAAALAALPG